MTDIEKQALALVNEIAGHDFVHPRDMKNKCWLLESICRAIEQHEAFKREVSEVCRDVRLHDGLHKLDRFILPKPDPLVVEAREICARVCEGWVDIPKNRAAAYRDGMHDDEADFAYALNALRKANERPSHD